MQPALQPHGVEAEQAAGASTSGPPDEPRGSGAECSIEPAMRRPRGPRNERPWRRPRRRRPAGRARPGRRARTRARRPRPRRVRLPARRPAVAGVDLHDGDVEVGVGARDAAVQRPRRRARTATSSPRSTCALSARGPGRSRRPSRGPSRGRGRPPRADRSAAPRPPSCSSSRKAHAAPVLVTCNLQVTTVPARPRGD